MVTVQQIKADLPDWPDQVIQEWLLGLANRPDTGWPPPEDVNFHPWGPILGYRPLSWWKNVSWKLGSHDVSFDELCKDTKQIAVQTAGEFKRGIKPTEARVKRALHSLATTGKLQAPPVAMKLSDGLSIIDGNHRITALMISSAEAKTKGLKGPSTVQDVWMGNHNKGEVPREYPDV